MIKYLTPTQLTLAQKKFYYKYHTHQDESVFLASSPDFLSPRAYELCKLCGRLRAIEIDADLKKEIDEVITQKKLSTKV